METQHPMLLLVDKPLGISSFDVIRVLRKQYGAFKMGHSGTLDPLATGLMLIGIGEGTKKLRELIGLPKVYEAEVCLGAETTTGDSEGKILREASAEHISSDAIQNALRKMHGKLEIAVPSYSAVKQGGVPLYKRARKGEDVTPPVKTMEIYSAEILNERREGEKMFVKVRWNVSSGTYIRSLAEELGRRLEIPATISALRRTRIGEYRVEDALRFEKDELAAIHNKGGGKS